MGKRFIAFAIFICLFAAPAAAQTGVALCAAAKKIVTADILLSAEVAAAFGKAEFSDSSDDCLYPMRVLRYPSADVLLVRAGEPGSLCRGSPAILSAFVIQRIGGGLKLVAKFREFAQLGGQGAVMETWPLEIAGDDAIAIQAGGVFQGFVSSQIHFFAFHAGALVELVADPVVALDADNEGATVDANKRARVEGSWFFDPTDKTALVVDYKIETKGASRVERVVWRLKDGKFTIMRGRMPKEVEQAGGG